jgi:hypothetical protein
MEYGDTSHNRTVYAAPAVAGLASIKHQSALRAFVVFYSSTFLQALETYGFLYRACKNVVYSRNVMRNTP